MDEVARGMTEMTNDSIYSASKTEEAPKNQSMDNILAKACEEALMVAGKGMLVTVVALTIGVQSHKIYRKIDFSRTSEAKELFAIYASGRMTTEEYLEQRNILWFDYLKEHNTLDVLTYMETKNTMR